MKKRLLIFFSMLLFIATARAGDYKSLVFQTSSGTTAVDLSSLVLTIANGKLTATNSSGTESFTLTDLIKMYFSTETTTGIKGVSTDSTDKPVTVYDVNGREMGSYSSLEAAKSSLRQGVYVIKQDNQTFKIVVR